MESIQRPKNPDQILIDRLYLSPGRKIRLIKIESEGDLNKRSNLVVEGILDDGVQINQLISIDGKTKDVGVIQAAKYDHNNDKVFFKTTTGIYELVNSDQFHTTEESKSEEYKKIEDGIIKSLKLAQENAVDVAELDKLIKERIRLQNIVQTVETERRLSEIDALIERSAIKVGTIFEFKILLEKTGGLDYSTIGIVEHENAHSNKAGALGVEEDGYMVIVARDRDGFRYKKIAVRGEFPNHWGREEQINADMQIANAPKEYGNVNSASDEEQIQALRNQLKK